MKIATIAFYTFLRHVRDIKIMITFLLLPIVLMLILGSAFNQDFTPKQVEKLKVGVWNENNGQLGQSFDQFLQSDAVRAQLQVERIDDMNAGIHAVKSGGLEALIHIPADLSVPSASSSQGEAVRIPVYSMKDSSYVEPILDSFVQAVNLDSVLVGLDASKTEGSDKGITASPLKEVKVVTEGKIPDGMDYYSVTTMFQALLYGGLFGVFAVTKDVGNHTYARMLAAPVRGLQFTVGKLLGSTITLFVIALFIYLVSKYGFQTNWEGSLWLILVVLFLFSVISIAFGMILAHLSRSTMVSALALFFLSLLFTLVSGGYSRVNGELTDVLSKFSPNTYSQQAIFASIFEGTLLHTPLIRLSLYAAILVVLALFAGRRRFA